MVTTITTNLSPVPSRSAPSTFSDYMDTWLGKISTWTIEVNSVATEVNSNTTSAVAAKDAALAAQGVAEAASAIASGAANFEGAWSSLSGALSVPASVTHDGDFWILLGNLADVTLSEPAPANSDWQVFDFLPSRSGNAGKVLTTDGTTDSWTSSLTAMTIQTAAYVQIADASIASGTHTFNYSSGDMQQLTATGDITLAFSNFPTGKVASMIIDAVNWGAHTITHPAGLLFEYGLAPPYTASGIDRLLVIKDKDNVYSLSIVGQDIKVAS